MKILVFEQRYTNAQEAGIGRFNLFANAWAAVGHGVTILAGMVNYLSGEKPNVYKCKLFVTNREKPNLKVIRAFDSFFGYRSFFGRLLSYFSFLVLAFGWSLFLEKPDIVVASSPPIFVGLLGYFTAWFKGSKFVFEIRDMWPDEPIELGFLKNKFLIKLSYFLEKFLYSRAASIVVNSPGIKEFLVEVKNIPAGKIEVIMNPVDMTAFANLKDFSLRENFDWSNKTVVLYTGALSAVYNLNSLLDIAQELKDLPILFVLLGNGRQKAALLKRSQDLNLANVLFLDAVSKKRVPEFIAAADICVAPLRNLPLLKYVYATKIFDYMAGGRPIVLSMAGVSADLVCNSAKCGLCLRPEDDKSLKEAIISLYRDKIKREKFGEAGQRYAAEHFKPEVLAEKYLAVFNQTNNRTKGRG